MIATILLCLLPLFAFTAGEARAADDAFRNTAPVVGPPKAFATPTITPFVVEGMGLEGFLVERHELPMVALEIDFPVGKVNDPIGKEGRTALCMDLLDEGTRSLDKNAFELKKADLAISVSSDGGREQSSVSFDGLTSNTEAGVALLAEVLLQPGLREVDFERLKARYVAAIAQSRASADSVLSRVNNRVFFGEGHPFAGVLTEASLGRITLKDCQEVHALLRPKGARVLVQGDITTAEVQRLFAKYLGSFRGNAPAVVATKNPPTPKAKYFFVDVPGAAQSAVWIGHAGPSRQSKDYIQTMLMAQVLGGGFSSRINMNLREKNGYTYGARGGFYYSRKLGTFAVSSSIKSEVTEPALREIEREMKGMAEPTDVELQRERQGSLLAFPARFATGQSTLSAASELVFFGLPFSTWNDAQRELAQADRPSVGRAAKTHLKTSDGVVVIVVGDKKVVQPALVNLQRDRVFGGGDIVELDADGNRVP